jgi:hypothetical protein
MIGGANTNRLLECSSRSLLREIASYADRTDAEIITDRSFQHHGCLHDARGDLAIGYRASE